MTLLSKGEFVSALAAQREVTKKEASELLDDVFAVIDSALIDELKDVKLGDIGTLKVVEVPERTHKNPKTGEAVIKPKHYAVKFKTNKNFKEDLAEVPVEG